ncbi:MAG: VTC domain-containing protein [Luteolibacter sp.]
MNADQNRIEFKFVLKPGLLEALRESVGEHLEADRGATDGYPVISEYFDTVDRNSYWQKIFGVPNRRRVRGRVYGRADGSIPPSSFIEVKHKLDGSTVKRRVTLDGKQLQEFSSGTLPETTEIPGEDRVLREIHELVHGGDTSPAVQIRYLRYAYDSGPEGMIRITFDTELSCRFRLIPLEAGDTDFELPLLEPGASIMEVKTIGNVPTWFRKIIGKYGLVPRGFSKYSTAIELYEHGNESQKVKTPA